MKLPHIIAISTAALLAFSIPMLTAKAGCGCGAGTPAGGQGRSPVSKSDSGSDVHHGNTGLVFNGCRGSCGGIGKNGNQVGARDGYDANARR